MWIVRLALRRTYTFVVAALLILAVGLVVIGRMSTDIFPEINIPVVSVVWQYTGMPADEVEQRIVLVNERVLTTSVNDIEHIESQSLFGVGVIRIYFHPHARIEAAVAQVTATSQAILKVMPPGIFPPYIVQYSATSVPIVQIAVSSDTLTEQQIFDYASNFIIQRLGVVQGARVPQPWGGKWPQVMKVTLARDIAVGREAVPPQTIDQDRAQAEATAAQVESSRASILVNRATVQQNGGLSQTALRQLNTLQTALQQTLTLQGLPPVQNGQLMPFQPAFQVRTLSQEQNGLMGLLTSQPPPSPRGMSRK
jgi:multidrug efflux pump subunit AcrB